jgi:hypothetical protein
MRYSIMLSVFTAVLASLSGVPATLAQGFLHSSGIYIVDGSNNQILLRGMGLGGGSSPKDTCC